MKKNVIIAESVLGTLERNSTLFGRGGIAVVPAASLAAILALHREGQADLIIAEHAPPDADGAKLCADIRADAALRDVSLIMISERSGPAVSDCQQAGANAILTKPLDPSELFAKVSHLLMVQDRMAVRVPLRISVNGRGQRSSFVGMSQNISVSGMLLDSSRTLQHGERVECSFILEGRLVTVSCVVVRAHAGQAGTYQYGVTFPNLDAKTFVLIEHAIKSGMRERGT